MGTALRAFAHPSLAAWAISRQRRSRRLFMCADDVRPNNFTAAMRDFASHQLIPEWVEAPRCRSYREHVVGIVGKSPKPRLVQALALKGNPFEHYVAETEPNIAEYAVKPPYFEAIDDRAKNTSSYVLFGDRGAGKSATRLTVFKELWARKAKGEHVPLAVNMTDFSAVLLGKKLHALSDVALINEVAFIVIESLLAWLSSLEDFDRKVFVEAMTNDESALCYSLLRDQYVSRPESKRNKSAREAMLLLNQAFLARNKLWAERRWDAIAGLFGTIVDALSKRHLDVSGIAQNSTTLIAKEKGEIDPILLLHKLVDLAKVFDFSGVVVLIDKVDETEAMTCH